MRKKIEKIFWDMEMIGNRRKSLFPLVVSIVATVHSQRKATLVLVGYSHGIIEVLIHKAFKFGFSEKGKKFGRSKLFCSALINVEFRVLTSVV